VVRSKGPTLRRNGRRASASARRRASPSRRLSGSATRSTTGRAALPEETTWTGSPVSGDAWNTVRNASWRRTTSASAASRTATSRRPATSTAAGML